MGQGPGSSGHSQQEKGRAARKEAARPSAPRRAHPQRPQQLTAAAAMVELKLAAEEGLEAAAAPAAAAHRLCRHAPRRAPALCRWAA